MDADLNDLKESLAKGRVVIVAGAGVTMAATATKKQPRGAPTACWTGLLEHGIDYCFDSEDEKEELRALLKRNKAELVATDITDAFEQDRCAGTIADWLEQTIGKLKPTNHELLNAIHALQAPILTTNYDNLLAESGSLSPVLWSNENMVDRWVRGKKQGVFHLHGHWEHIDSVVFGIRSYAEVIRHPQAQTAMRTLASSKKLLFIGCGLGLEDTNFRAFRQWLKDVHGKSSEKHYLLVPEPELAEAKKQFPPKGRIQPFSYGDHYTDLPAFLHGVAPQEQGPVPPSLQPDPYQGVAEYLHAAVNLHRSIGLAGFETKLRIPIQLEDLHVPLHAQVDQRAIGKTEAGSAEEMCRDMHASNEIPLIDAFAKAESMGGRRGLVILADPGAGKTTHLKRLLLKVIQNSPQDLHLPEGIIPVFLPLRELQDIQSGLDAFLQAQLDDHPHLKVETDFAENLIKRDKILFLLDGLDEIPQVENRQQVVQWIEQAIEQHASSRFVVTCRYAGYRALREQFSGQFLELHLRPLDTEQARTFIHNWFRTVEIGLGGQESVAAEKANELIERLKEPDFRAARVFELTRNPLLLTAICLVHRDRGRLPHRRAELYEECVNVLLERWRDAKKIPVTVGAAKARRILQPIAYWLHGEEGRTRAKISELAPIIEPALARVGESKLSAAAFLDKIRDESGLLTGWSEDSYGFMHLGFQEYLAAREIHSQCVTKPELLTELANRFGESWWREITLLVLALGDPLLFEPFFKQAVQTQGFATDRDLVRACMEDALEISRAPFLELLRKDSTRNHQMLWERQLAALQVLLDCAPRMLDGFWEGLSQHPHKEIREIVDRYIAPATPKRTKTQSGLASTMTTKDGSELVLIPSGTFLMGSTKEEQEFWTQGNKNRLQWFACESPQHKVTLSPYYLSRYPITNAQYGEYLKENSNAQEPEYWADNHYNQPQQPVVGVSWEAAQAYCEWAGVRLPTEAQWEYACRAGTTTAFWNGETEAELEKIAWFDKNPAQKLQPVGEKSANPWGLYGMHGNVWEWCQDWFGEYENKHLKNPKGPKSGSDRVFRGGGFWSNAGRLRSASRSRGDPSGRWNNLGFRVAVPATD